MARVRRYLVGLAVLLPVLASCSGQPYEPAFGFMLETHYQDGVPAGQQSALADGVLTDREVEQATQASNACAGAVPGVASVKPFRWVEEDGEFTGGELEFDEDADRDIALEAAQACYFEHAGLIEFAWLDQFYFGEWSEENLRD